MKNSIPNINTSSTVDSSVASSSAEPQFQGRLRSRAVESNEIRPLEIQPAADMQQDNQHAPNIVPLGEQLMEEMRQLGQQVAQILPQPRGAVEAANALDMQFSSYTDHFQEAIRKSFDIIQNPQQALNDVIQHCEDIIGSANLDGIRDGVAHAEETLSAIGQQCCFFQLFVRPRPVEEREPLLRARQPHQA